MVTYEEINEALGPAEQLDPEQLEDLLQSFENEGVQVVEKEKESAAPLTAATTKRKAVGVMALECGRR